MKSKLILIYFIIFCACEKTSNPLINQDSGETNISYDIDFESLNTGIASNQCSLVWNMYDSEDFQNYQLNFNQSILFESNIANNNSYTLEMNPGTFKKVFINVNGYYAYFDSLEVYTRPIYPITNLSAAANANNWYTTMYWNKSKESVDNFNAYQIYRSTNSNQDFNLIAELSNINDSTFVDSLTIWGVEYFYKINTLVNENFFRSSTIKSNVYDYDNTNEISVTASSNLIDRVRLNWEHNLSEEEFYSIEIYRTDEQFSNPCEDLLLATIINYQKLTLDDSFLVGDGITWFYKLKLIDKFGNVNYSEIESGITYP